jgi:lysozyme family protein
MARCENLVRFILKWETGVSDERMANEPLFEKAKKKGFANDPSDLGGATMCDITLKTYTEYRKRKGLTKPTVEDLKAISYGEWLEVLKTMFWDRWKADQIQNQSVANFLVDWVWASGVYGIKLPQKVLNVSIDGVVGPKTLAAINEKDPAIVFGLMKQERIDYTERICKSRAQNRKFRTGWLNRINDLKYKP